MNGMGYGRIGSTKQTLEEAKLKNNVMYFHQQYRVVDDTQGAKNLSVLLYQHIYLSLLGSEIFSETSGK